MANSDAGKLIEDIESLRFRQSCTLERKKRKREIAFTLAIDIIVESVSVPIYLNANSLPSHSFFGYVVLGSQDCLLQRIPLTFGRNRIYYERNNEAFAQWEFHRQFYSQQDYVYSLFRLLAGSDAPLPAYNPPKLQFVEIPVRTISIQVLKDTQYTVEVTQWEPVSYINDNGITYDGKSQQKDGDKDKKNGADKSQPRQNNSSNPFNGNQSASSAGDIANSGLNLLDSSTANDPTDDGSLPAIPLKYSLGFYFKSYSKGCNEPRQQFYVEVGRYDEPPRSQIGDTVSTYISCNGEQGGIYSLIVNDVIINSGANSLLSGRAFGTRPFYNESELNGLYFPNGKPD